MRGWVRVGSLLWKVCVLMDEGDDGRGEGESLWDLDWVR